MTQEKKDTFQPKKSISYSNFHSTSTSQYTHAQSHSLTNTNAGCLWNNMIFQPPVFSTVWLVEEAWCVSVQYAVNVQTK